MKNNHMFTNEQYIPENLKNIKMIEIAKETVRVATEIGQVETEIAKAVADGNISLYLAHASTRGVLMGQEALLQVEAKRRDLEDGPMNKEEEDELFKYMVDTMISHLADGLK